MKNVWLEKSEARENVLVIVNERAYTQYVARPLNHQVIVELAQVSHRPDHTVVCHTHLDMKQSQPNPWDQVTQKYPPGTMIEGTVRDLTDYGAFIEVEEGIDGLLHIHDMSRTRKIGHPNELLERGQKIRCQVLSVDRDRKRIALGLKQLHDNSWQPDILGQSSQGNSPKNDFMTHAQFVYLESTNNIWCSVLP